MEAKPRNFIEQIIDDSLVNNTYNKRVLTRFPPEPNGYLHIGHAKSICLNFGLALQYQNGACNLRFDDTNPLRESDEYAKAIEEDVKWLGFKWSGDIKHASDYFQQLYNYALKLIEKGLAYVCDLSAEEVRKYRGTLTEPGKDSPFRNRSISENLNLFERMKNGEFPDGSKTLRAKIDMTSGNINMRDPAIYRIRKVSHHRTADAWFIYPMYDYAHCLSDAIEDITHSICTLEFQDHRPLYDWILEHLVKEPRPHQYEFARLNLDYTVTSKRKLKALVDGDFVTGWNDPRMLTIAGLRRRGYTPEAIRSFCETIGVSKKDTVISMSILEDSLRNDLNERALRRMAVLDPIKVTLTNYPEGKVEYFKVANHPQNQDLGQRDLTFSREVFIDRDDFMENPPKGYFRLSPGGEVRLRYGYIIRCEEVIKDSSGKVIALKCSYDSNSLGKNPEDRKVKGIIHWVDAGSSITATIRLYDRLFKVADPSKEETEDRDFTSFINPDSLCELKGCQLEPSLLMATNEDLPFQFERLGYFKVDRDTVGENLIYNRCVTLRDSWAKIQK